MNILIIKALMAVTNMSTPLVSYETLANDLCAKQPRYFFDAIGMPYLPYVLVPVAFCTVIFNAAIFALLLVNRKLNQPSHQYVLHLAFCDLLVGLSSWPSRLTMDIGRHIFYFRIE